MQVLEYAKCWDEEPVKTKVINRDLEIANPNSKDNKNFHVKTSEQSFSITQEVSDKSTQDMDEDLISAEKILEMQKLIEKFVEEDGSSMVDFVYDEMERVFTSVALNEYATNSLREFEELGLDSENN